MSDVSEKWNSLMKSPVAWTEVLSAVLKDFDCVTGTIHRTDSQTGLLVLTAHQGIPPFVLDKIQAIPFGKGIAGCAAERREAFGINRLPEKEMVCYVTAALFGFARKETFSPQH